MVPSILKAMQDMSNFSVVWTQPEDGNYGVPVGDGSGDWNGMVGMVHRKEADMVAAGLAVTLIRSEVISYTYAFLQQVCHRTRHSVP